MERVLEEPEFLESIPKGAQIIFLPKNDPELYEANLKLIQKNRKRGKNVFAFELEIVPRVQTVYVPQFKQLPNFQPATA